MGPGDSAHTAGSEVATAFRRHGSVGPRLFTVVPSSGAQRVL